MILYIFGLIVMYRQTYSVLPAFLLYSSRTSIYSLSRSRFGGLFRLRLLFLLLWFLLLFGLFLLFLSLLLLLLFRFLLLFLDFLLLLICLLFLRLLLLFFLLVFFFFCWRLQSLNREHQARLAEESGRLIRYQSL